MKARLRRAAACSRDFCSGSLRLRQRRPFLPKPNAASTAGSAPQTRNANAVDDAVRSDGAVGSAGTDAAAVSKKQPVELQVFIAASLSPAMQEIAQHYMESNPDVKITFNADSSGKLQTQIEEGYDCDLFFSAGQKQMDALEQEPPYAFQSRQHRYGGRFGSRRALH